jgi:hypothetical protein
MRIKQIVLHQKQDTVFATAVQYYDDSANILLILQDFRLEEDIAILISVAIEDYDREAWGGFEVPQMPETAFSLNNPADWRYLL